MRFVGRRMSYANVVATLALVVAMGGTAAAAGVLITSNSQVRHDTISGHNAPSGRHANIIGGSIDGRDLSTRFKASLAATQAHCAKGLQQAGSGLCFDPSPRAVATFATAPQTCRSAQLRLPTIGELAEVFEHVDAIQPFQWTSGYYIDGSIAVAPLVEQDDSRQLTIGVAQAGDFDRYRCVGNPTS
jgi:hypothetical protein